MIQTAPHTLTVYGHADDYGQYPTDFADAVSAWCAENCHKAVAISSIGFDSREKDLKKFEVELRIYDDRDLVLVKLFFQ